MNTDNINKEFLSATLQDLNGGVFAAEVETAIRDCALATTARGRKAQVQITLDMEQIGESNQIAMKHTIKYSRPTDRGRVSEESGSKTPLYVNNTGRLTLFPEKQMKLQLEGERAQA